MHVPACDIVILQEPSQLARMLVRPEPAIKTNAHVARKYGLSADRVRLGESIDEAAHYHVSLPGDGAIVLEDDASLCSLLCAVDPDGNMAMLHAPLIAREQELLPFAAQYLQHYRNKVDALLGKSRTLVVSGMDSDDAGAVMRTIRTTFPDVSDTVTQVSRNRLQGNTFPEQTDNEQYTGMLFIPQVLSSTSRNTLALLHDSLRKIEIAHHL